MKTLEVDEILKILEERGWQAWLCDTPVPVYESVHAGNPADPGQVPPGMVLMPTAFVKEIAGMKPKDVTDLVNKWVTDKRISDYGNSRKGVLWEILHQAGLYEPSKQNWNRRVF